MTNLDVLLGALTKVPPPLQFMICVIIALGIIAAAIVIARITTL